MMHIKNNGKENIGQGVTETEAMFIPGKFLTVAGGRNNNYIYSSDDFV